MKDVSKSIVRTLLGTARKKDKDAVSKWRENSPENSSFLDHLQLFWNNPGQEKSSGNLDIARERLWIRMNSSRIVPKTHSLSYRILQVAAILVFVALTSGVAVYLTSEKVQPGHQDWVEVATEAGQQSKVTLSDGSIVWLNAGTVLKYRPDKKSRQVYLNGEAFFKVSHDRKYPFIVDAGTTKVRVLGTTFDISHYSGSPLTAVSLLSGKVEFSTDPGKAPVILKPGEKIVYNEQEQSLTQTSLREADLLWRQGILAFSNEPFNELISKLERYYAVSFVYNRKAFQDIHYTGTINNLSINKVLEFINLTIPINYEIDNKTIKLDLRK